MAKRSEEHRSTKHRGYLQCNSLSPQDIWCSFRSASPSFLSQFDLWERSFLKSQSSALCHAGVYGSDHYKFSIRSLGGHGKINHNKSAERERWQSASNLAPEGVPRSNSQAALEQSNMRRAELIEKLQEVHSNLDTQTDLLRAKESQLQQLKHEQLTKTLSVHEGQKKAVEPAGYFEESCQWKEHQDKVLQLEMDVLKMKSSLESRSSVQTTASHSYTLHSSTVPIMRDYFCGEGQKNAEREIKQLKKAIKEAEGKAEALDAEKELAQKQLNLCKKDQQDVLIQAEELKQRHNMSMKIQNELQDQLNETRCRHGQLKLEKDLLFTKMQRLEDNIEHQKFILATALSDKDRLLQDKLKLHQDIQSLELQLQRAQMGKEGFTQQVCELHSELTQAKSQGSQQQQNNILMKEELRSIKEVNDKLSADLTSATERLDLTLQQLYELQAEKLIHTNQIAALENERLQLISEKEELMDVFDPGDQEEIRKLKEKCCQLKELQETMEHERMELATHCQGLKKKVQNVEAEYELKEQELKCMEKKMEQEKEELKRVAAHWNDRWLEVAMTLQSTQAQLDESKKQQQETGTEKDEELVQLKGELQKVLNVLKNRETELEVQQQELQSAHSQVTQQGSKVRRLEQLLAQRDQKLKEMDLAMKDLLRQRDTVKTEVQTEIAVLENELKTCQDLDTYENMNTQLNAAECRSSGEQCKQESDEVEQKLSKQVKEERDSPIMNRTEITARFGLIDPDQNRRLITDELKSLFKEREVMRDRVSPVIQRKGGLKLTNESR